MRKHLWEINHPYYCSESGYYYSTEGPSAISGWGEPMHYESFSEFVGEWSDCDLDMNLVFRWDWVKRVPDETLPEGYGPRLDSEGNLSTLTLFFMMQRKGCKKVITIDMKDSDEPKVIEYLKPRWEHMKLLWEGIS